MTTERYTVGNAQRRVRDLRTGDRVDLRRSTQTEKTAMQYRVKKYKLRNTWWRIQEREKTSDKWRDSFVAPYSGPDGKHAAEIYCRVLIANQQDRRSKP